MQAFTRHTGIAAPLLTANIDTDAIIPSREMKLVDKRGLGEGLFAAWRYTLPGGREPRPDFVLNQSAYAGTSILLAGDNFGCGSSREHAVWALAEYGIRAIIAPGFGSIFFNNCINNGLLPVVLDSARVRMLAKQIERDPQARHITIDLEQLNVIAPDGENLPFALEENARQMLLRGLDRIALTLSGIAQIEAFETQDRERRPWAYLDPIMK